MTNDDPRSAFFPDVDDPRESRFWEGTLANQIRLPRCSDCTALRWPTTAHCPECLSLSAEWEAIAPRGHLWSYTIYRRAMNPAFRERVPYAVGLIELDEGVRMIGALDIDFDRLRVDLPVAADFERVDEDFALPVWRLPEESKDPKITRITRGEAEFNDK